MNKTLYIIGGSNISDTFFNSIVTYTFHNKRQVSTKTFTMYLEINPYYTKCNLNRIFIIGGYNESKFLNNIYEFTIYSNCSIVFSWR